MYTRTGVGAYGTLDLLSISEAFLKQLLSHHCIGFVVLSAIFIVMRLWLRAHSVRLTALKIDS